VVAVVVAVGVVVAVAVGAGCKMTDERLEKTLAKKKVSEK
jgi:hypothetical protein